MADDDTDRDVEIEDNDRDDHKRKREEQLGFRPQKEIIYNKLLPYSKDIDEDSTKWFKDIKVKNFIKT